MNREQIRDTYVQRVEAILQERKLNEDLAEFRNLVAEGDLRKAYVFVDRLKLNEMQSDSFRRADEDFYWTFVQ